MASGQRLRTAWHPLLVLMLRKLLPDDGFDVTGEFSLTREPLRLDVVVIRKLAEARPLPLLPGLLDPMPAHLLISFKGPTDALDEDDATMLWVYLGLYLIQNKIQDLASVAIRVVAPSVPSSFLHRIHDLSGFLRYQEAGLWEGKLGKFALRLVETERAFSREEEHLWHVFSPSLLRHHPPEKMSPLELELYTMLYQQVEKLRNQGDRMMFKDLDLAATSLEEAMTQLLMDVPLEVRLAGLAPEQRLAGLAPEQRLAGLTPEQIRGALGRDRALLALPDDLLKLQPDEVLATLSPEAREEVRKRIGR